MEIEQTEQTEDLQVENLEGLQALAEESDAGSDTDLDETPPESEEYAPDYSYMYKDEKREFDERVRGAVGNKETEEYLRDLYTKADGLDSYKEKYTKRDSEYGELYDHSQALTSGYQKLQTMRESGDHRGLQNALGLSKDFVIEWGLALAEEDELPEAQKQQLQSQRDMEAKMTAYEQKISQFEASHAESRVQDDLNQLEMFVSSESIKPVAQAMKEKGHDLVETVVAIGQLEYQKTGIEPSIESVVSRVADQYRYLVQQEPVQQQQQQQAVKQPTIPSINGNNQATVDKPVSSMDDLKKLAELI